MAVHTVAILQSAKQVTEMVSSAIQVFLICIFVDRVAQSV